MEDVEALLVSLILDGKLNGRIDQVKGVLVKEATPGYMITGKSAAETSSAIASSIGVSFGSGTRKNMEMRNFAAVDQLTQSLQGLTSSLSVMASDQYFGHPVSFM